ncbi:MAG: hypothetical protein HY513_00015 [Candidatus Aenigmarchaeota archaeon]|nr:hypothetical protein [Candidatus Aenigmarchaeota archaeon]
MLVERKCIDLTSLSFDGQEMPVEYVKGNILWKNDEPYFQHIVREVEAQPQPGLFLTPKVTGKYVRLRWALNRHGILKSDVFYDSKGMIYRDIDAKGIGYHRGFPPRFLGIRFPEMESDMKMRGLLHYEVAEKDRFITEQELHRGGLRTARHVVHVELDEVVDMNGNVLSLEDAGERLEMNLVGIRPVQVRRAMGTTSRVQNIIFCKESNNQAYVKESLDDAISLVSLELGQSLKPHDYIAWFAETHGAQIAKLHHKVGGWTDFMGQIHGGLHNVTLDCRLLDTYHFETPLAARLRDEELKKNVERDPKLAWLLEPRMTKEEAQANNEKGFVEDKCVNMRITEWLAEGVDEIYPIGSLKSEVQERFEKAYKNAA